MEKPKKTRLIKRIALVLLFSLVTDYWLLVTPPIADAAFLTAVSDTLSNPRPTENSNHTWGFTATSTIPVSGKIIITPKNGAFTIPVAMDSFDFDLSVNGSEKSLSSAPGVGSGSAIGVNIVSGTSGSITFTLNDTDPISAGSTVIIKAGTNAVISGGGIRQITNPSTQGSYTYTVSTHNAASVEIDTKTGAVAIVPSVGISSNYNPQVETPSITPPSQSFTGTLAISITTATTGADIYYTTDGTVPTTSSNLYTASFNVNSTTTVKAYGVKAGIADSSVATEVYVLTTSSGGGGSGGGGGGGGGLILPPFVTPVIYTNSSGQAIAGPEPARIIHQCSNGVILTIDLPKNFWLVPVTFTITCLTRNTANQTNPINFTGDIPADTVFGIKAEDSKGKIDKLLLPAALQMEYTQGHLLGYDPSTLIPWASTPPSNLPWKILSNNGRIANNKGVFGSWQYLGLYTTVGTKKIVDCSTRKADLNCDNRVNLTDLSILLYNWNGPKNNPKSDINKDTRVDLTDFSILLYYWTD